MSAVPTITLNNGVSIPQLGFGVFLIEPADTKDATLAALEIGCRHIDTAQMYGNEAQVGEAVRASGIDRDDIFVTSKLNNSFHGYEEALNAFDQTLKDLAFDYLDLFLVHWPLPGVGDFVETWKAMEEIYRSGRCRAIGVSNFQKHHLQRLFDETEIVPAVNQIEVHPYLVQDELRAFGTEHGIPTEAWSPLGRGAVLEEPTLVDIAKRYDRTPAQVTLRWALQRGDIVFPKSANRHRMEENFDPFGFELSQQEIDQISALNRDERIGPDPDTFNYVP